MFSRNNAGLRLACASWQLAPHSALHSATFKDKNMRDVSVIGIGQVPVGDLWEKPIYILAVEAMLAAIHDSKVEQIDAVYVGNMLSSTLAGQDLLAGLIADQVGLTG